MPLIHYVCECKYSVSKFHRQAKDAPATLKCEKCGKDAKRALKAPASRSVVTIDNGVQSRSVEVNLEVIEANQEQAEKDRLD